MHIIKISMCTNNVNCLSINEIIIFLQQLIIVVIVREYLRTLVGQNRVLPLINPLISTVNHILLCNTRKKISVKVMKCPVWCWLENTYQLHSRLRSVSVTPNNVKQISRQDWLITDPIYEEWTEKNSKIEQFISFRLSV